ASVKVCLVSANFSKEITTTALWLRDQGVDIRCVRFRPYRLGGELLAEIEQVIPPPDTDELIVGPGARARLHDARKPSSRMKLEAVYAALPNDRDRRLAKQLQEWFEDAGGRIFTTSNGFAPEFAMGEYSLYPLKITRDARVVVWFNYLKNREPFTQELKR